MKKTTFKETELFVSINYHKTYMEVLDEDGISYSTRTLPIFQSLLPLDIVSYGGYEVISKTENGNEKYAYPFITEKKDFTKCVTFFSESKLDNLYLLDLEQALRTEKLVFESDGDDCTFQGFDFSKGIKIEELLEKTVELEDGCRYEFTKVCEFPEGITGKKILADGNAVNVFLAKETAPFLSFIINEKGNGWYTLNQEEISRVFKRQ